MPHICLKKTQNINQKISSEALFSQVCQLIIENLENAALESCAAWEEVLPQVYFGSGDPSKSKAILTIEIFSGRPETQRQALAQACSDYLKTVLAPQIEGSDCSLFVEVREMNKQTCAKFKI